MDNRGQSNTFHYTTHIEHISGRYSIDTGVISLIKCSSYSIEITTGQKFGIFFYSNIYFKKSFISVMVVWKFSGLFNEYQVQKNSIYLK